MVEEGSERLVARRRRGRRRLRVLVAILLLVLIGSGIWFAWQPWLRITNIAASNGDSSLALLAREKIVGTYLGIIPRDSIIFFPEHDMRAAILATRSGIVAVSIQRDSLTSLVLTPSERVPVARWCGLAPTEGVDAYCYLFDTGGFIYAASDTATSTQTLNPFVLYAPLEGDTQEPLGAILAHANALPAVFNFARGLGDFSSPVVSIILRGDEVDCLLVSGTRITYVRGDEQNAFANLTSASSDLNLADGSLEYVDLRFSGKVYPKKKQ